jgi:hypothetical protein
MDHHPSRRRDRVPSSLTHRSHRRRSAQGDNDPRRHRVKGERERGSVELQ